MDEKAESTLGQQIYQELESRILLGEWLPNTKVTLRTLALSLNTSMQPVREALGRLVAASALEATPNRAFRVPELDRAAADEIWSLRLLLEGEAAARFAARRNSKACERLAAATDACRTIDYGRDLKATMGAIAAWNSSIIQAAGSQLLYDTVGRLYLRCAPFLAHSLSAPVAHDEEFLSFILHIQDELLSPLRPAMQRPRDISVAPISGRSSATSTSGSAGRPQRQLSRASDAHAFCRRASDLRP